MSKFPEVIDWITMMHYVFMYNDLHYKIALMDIPPNEKHGNYVSYEPGRRRLLKEVSAESSWNVNGDNRVRTVSCSNYYLYFYIVYWIVSVGIVYFVWGKKKRKKVN